MKKYLILFAILILLIVTFFSGCNEISETGGQISETLNPPKYSITSKVSREGYEGADKVGYIDVTVLNNGGTGKGTVYAKVTQGSNEWTKSKSVNLGNDESTTLSFRFTEIQFWTLDSWSYTVWVD